MPGSASRTKKKRPKSENANGISGIGGPAIFVQVVKALAIAMSVALPVFVVVRHRMNHHGAQRENDASSPQQMSSISPEVANWPELAAATGVPTKAAEAMERFGKLPLTCPHRRLGLHWMRPQRGGGEDPLAVALRDGPCGREDQELYRNRTDYHWLGIGIQKGGTTTLFQRLYGHPASFMGEKEMGFFLDKTLDAIDPGFAKIEYAKRHWWDTQTVETGRRRGEITPNYMTQPKVPARVRRILGMPARFVVMLRDPVKRAYSLFQMAKRLKMKKIVADGLTFEQVIQADYDLIVKCRKQHKWALSWYSECYAKEHKWIGPLGHGMYYEHLSAWWQHYPPCSTLVLDQRDLNVDGVDSCVYSFLDMRPYQFELTQENRNHSAGWMMEDEYSKNDPMKPETELLLRELFKPHNQKLEQLLGRHFEWGY